MPRHTREFVKDRRKQIISLVRSGVTISTISKQLGIGERQVSKDLKAIRGEMLVEYRAKDVWERIMDYSESQRLRIRKLWEIVTDDTVKPIAVIKALKELREEDIQSIRQDQILGTLPKDVVMPVEEKVVTEINVYQALLQISREDKRLKDDIREGKVIDVEVKDETGTGSGSS